MRLSNLLIFHAVVALVFGILFVLAPAPVVSLYGVTLGLAGTLMARSVGACLIGIGLACWFARSSGASELRQGVILSFFIGDVVGFIVALLGQLSGVTNALGWINVAIWLSLTLGLGYFRFLKPSPA